MRSLKVKQPNDLRNCAFDLSKSAQSALSSVSVPPPGTPPSSALPVRIYPASSAQVIFAQFLNKYPNQYKAAEEKTKDITKRLINLEEKLAFDIRCFFSLIDRWKSLSSPQRLPIVDMGASDTRPVLIFDGTD